MILAVDAGNSNIVLGLAEGGRILSVGRMRTERDASAIEYAVKMKKLMELFSFSGAHPSGGIISSVVPSVLGSLKGALELLTGRKPLTVTAGMRTGLDIRVDEPAALGADRIVDAVAARALYGAPAIIIDMGTANTVSVLDSSGALIGGVIMPGLRLSASALSSAASLLTQVSFEAPSRVIGSSTAESMRSGLILGCACTLDKLTERIEEELGYPCTLVITGGMCPVILPHCRRKLIHDPELLLRGLTILYDMNT